MKTKKRIIIALFAILAIIIALFCIRILINNTSTFEGEVLGINEDTIFMRVDNKPSISTSGNVYIMYNNPSEFEIGDYIKIKMGNVTISLTSDPPYLGNIKSITKIKQK